MISSNNYLHGRNIWDGYIHANVSRTSRMSTRFSPVFLQNEEIFVYLDKFDELDKTTYEWIRIHLQLHASIENIVV